MRGGMSGKPRLSNVGLRSCGVAGCVGEGEGDGEEGSDAGYG